jgi:cation:H+ antiporter|uniref:Sodium/calcium exchanger membrane region n=1 Tax=Chelativorans sp. (strain BNC1) TaxID=266779 RepID=Q11J54_CHESB|nr:MULTISPECIES: sodium/calcium exchanger membrane region [Chelativorans]
MDGLPVNTQDFPIWVNAAVFLAASIVVWSGGVRLTIYVDRISTLTRLGQVFAGMLLLGCVTSLPEVANVITASSAGIPALAVNNLLGSAAINVFFLAIGDAVVRRDALTSIVASPATLMMSVLCMLVLIAVAVAITTGDILLYGVGAWGLALAAVSVVSFWLSSGYADRSPWKVSDKREESKAEAETGEERGPLSEAVWKAALAGAVIFAAGYVLSQTGDALAQQTGLGAGMVGFALIGVATSTPELSTIIQSIRLRRYEMAFGQVLGTNFVNLSLIVLADAVFPGAAVINELGRFEVLSSLLAAGLIGIFIVGLLERRDAAVLRMGYDSLAVVVLFLGGLAALAFVQ